MNLFKSDFWPPLQGASEKFDGMFVSLQELGVALEVPQSAYKALASEDEGELSDVLEEIFDGKEHLAPERLVWLSRKRVQDAPQTISALQGYYAYWPTERWIASPALAEILRNSNVVGPVSFSYKYSRFIPAGADAIIWLLGFIGVALWFILR